MCVVASCTRTVNIQIVAERERDKTASASGDLWLEKRHLLPLIPLSPCGGTTPQMKHTKCDKRQLFLFFFSFLHHHLNKLIPVPSHLQVKAPAIMPRRCTARGKPGLRFNSGLMLNLVSFSFIVSLFFSAVLEIRHRFPD